MNKKIYVIALSVFMLIFATHFQTIDNANADTIEAATATTNVITGNTSNTLTITKTYQDAIDTAVTAGEVDLIIIVDNSASIATQMELQLPAIIAGLNTYFGTGMTITVYGTHTSSSFTYSGNRYFDKAELNQAALDQITINLAGSSLGLGTIPDLGVQVEADVQASQLAGRQPLVLTFADNAPYFEYIQPSVPSIDPTTEVYTGVYDSVGSNVCTAPSYWPATLGTECHDTLTLQEQASDVHAFIDSFLVATTTTTQHAMHIEDNLNSDFEYVPGTLNVTSALNIGTPTITNNHLEIDVPATTTTATDGSITVSYDVTTPSGVVNPTPNVQYDLYADTFYETDGTHTDLNNFSYMKSDAAPVITINNNKTMNEENPLTDAELKTLFGINAVDDVDGDITSSVVVDQSTVDYSTPGTYYVTFTVTDSIGQETSVQGELEIIDVLPTISTAKTTLTVPLGAAAVDYRYAYGATATEIAAGDLSASIVADDSMVNLHKTGSYPVRFTVTDEEGNVASKTVILIVQRETMTGDPITPEIGTLPVIGLESQKETPEETVLSDEEIINLFGVIAADVEDGIITNITVDQSAVDYSTPGSYPVKFTAIDSSKNEVTEEATLIVTDILPTITTKKTEITVPVGTTAVNYMSEYGATATEITAGDLTENIAVDSSSVDLNTVGTYTVGFSVADEEGNEVSTDVILNVEETVIVETGTYTVMILIVITSVLVGALYIKAKVKASN